jgi:hypothetical protein
LKQRQPVPFKLIDSLTSLLLSGIDTLDGRRFF